MSSASETMKRQFLGKLGCVSDSFTDGAKGRKYTQLVGLDLDLCLRLELWGISWLSYVNS